MPIPTSTDFDLIDWNSRADSSSEDAIGLPLDDVAAPITSYAFMPKSDAAVPALIQGKVWMQPVIETAGLVSIGAFADTLGIPLSKQAASLIQIDDLSAGMPSTFTFEFDLLLEAAYLPDNFDDPDTRLFVGAIDAQMYTAGFLFSRRGIALAPYPSSPSVTPLGGSASLIIDANGLPKDSVTVRAIVDSETGRMAIYVNDTAAAYGAGAAMHPEYADLDPLLFSKVPTGFSVLVPSYATTKAGHYNIAATKSAGPFTDSIVVQATAQSAQMLANKSETTVDAGDAQSTYFHLGSLRLSSDKLYPSIKPVAVARSSGNVLVNDILPMDGSDSFDREGRLLQYNWEIEVSPEGSAAKLRGAATASATVGGAEDDNAAVVTFSRPTAAYNSWHLDITDQPLATSVTSNANMSLILKADSANKKIKIQLATDKNGTPTTTAAELVQAFINKQSSGYNIEIAGGETYDFLEIDPDTGLTEPVKRVYPGLCIASLGSVGSTGLGLIPVGSTTFSGGRGSSEIKPIFIPDKPGIYILSLTVAVQLSSGSYSFSAKDFLQVTAALTAQILEHRPASDYIWAHLPDFWNLVQDKQYFTSMWSAMTQAISSDLLATWQNDYAKALKDVSQRYQRRWINYGGKITFDPNYSSLLTGDIDSVALLDIDAGAPLTGTSVSSVAIDLGAGNETEVPPLLPGPVIVRSLAGGPQVVTISSVEPSAGEGESTSKWTIVTEAADIPAFRLIDDRSAGLFIKDPTALDTPIATSSVFADKTYPMQSILPDTDVVRLYGTGAVKDVTVIGNVTEYEPGGTKNSVRLNVDAQTVGGSFFLWDHLRRSKGLFFETLPYFTFVPDFEGLPNLDLNAYPVSLGDYAEIKLVDPYTSTEITVALPILARSSHCLFVDWIDLLAALSVHPQNSNGRVWVGADLLNGEIAGIELASCTRARKRRAVVDLVSIPLIKSDTMDVYGDVEVGSRQFNVNTGMLETTATTENRLTTTVLREGLDFLVKSGSIVFKDYLVGKAVCTAGSTELALEPGLVAHELFRGEAALDEIGAGAVMLLSGDAGVYKAASVIVDDSILSQTADDILSGMSISLMTAPRISGTVDFCIPRFCSYSPVSDDLWAEVSYFDNWQTIENNFGMFVGFPKSLVDNYDPTLDYLSVIKSLWFAYMNGPDFENLDLALEAFFNVPFTDVACQVVYLDEGDPTLAEDGKIVVYEIDEGRYRTYTYPHGAALAVNPRSSKLYGETRTVTSYKLVASEDEKAALSEDERKLYEDSVLDPYTKFVDFADIVDYILDPELLDRQMQGEDVIKKYHTFLVDVPLGIAGSTEVFPLVKAFLSEAKPAYTNFILVGSFSLEDAISVIDEEFLLPTLTVTDTPHTAPFFAQALDVDSFGLPVASSASEALLWPEEKTLEKVVSVDNSAIEVAGLFHTPPNGYLFDHPAWGNPTVFELNASFVYGHNDGTGNPGAFTGAHHHPTALAELLFDSRSIGFYVPGDPTLHLVDLAFIEDVVPPATMLLHGLPAAGTASAVQAHIAPGNGPPSLLVSLNEKGATGFYFFPVPVAELPAPVTTYWGELPGDLHDGATASGPYPDVKNKYESGYCEGVLDDYSGDGSWNDDHHMVDMVNTLNSDIDVINSRLWVPVTDIGTVAGPLGGHEGKEFIVGEELAVYTEPPAGQWVQPECVWVGAPPVVLHVGAGHHPKLPGPVSPQFDHENTYLILGFEGKNVAEKSDHANEARLDVLDAVGNNQTDDVWLLGKTSNATALVLKVAHLHPDAEHPPSNGALTWHVPAGPTYQTRSNPKHEHLFLLEYLWQGDKLIEYGPKSDPELIVTTYIPVIGTPVDTLKSVSPIFADIDEDPNAPLDHYETETVFWSGANRNVLQYQTQQYPYTPLVDANRQFVPSFGPGLLTSWSNIADPASEHVAWGYTDTGAVAEFPKEFAQWALPAHAAAHPLRNVHMGMKFKARKDMHFSHGFCEFFVPGPKIVKLSPGTTMDMRVEGYYFCDDDSTRVGIPPVSSDANYPGGYGDPENNGIIGGSWVFFRHSVEPSIERAVDSITFETGVHQGKTVFGIEVGPPTNQTSTGHILEVDIPPLPKEGYYDVIVRNFRPYKMSQSSSWLYHVDEDVLEKGYNHIAGEWSSGAWGTDPFGGGT